MTAENAKLAARPTRTRASPEERRGQIIEAALSCFSARGFHATTMDDLVAASGLSKGSLYWHFQSKEDVFLALFDYIAHEVFGRVDEATEAGDVDVVSVLHREFALFLERFGAERKLLLAWVDFLSHPRGRERMAVLYSEARQKFAELIQLGVDRGELRPLPAESVAAVLTGMLDALVLQAAIDPDFVLGDHEEAVWEILSHGVRSH